MKSNFAYVSILSTDNYLVGLMVMYFSLKLTKPKYNFFCLVTPNIKEANINILKHLDINIIPVNPIVNPYNSNINSRKYYNYSKLNIFNLTNFDKVVYLDADMIIMHNIDELFNKPHMSAVNSGGMLPDKKTWTKLNSGLMVIEPSAELFEEMKKSIGKIEKEKGKGDQSFLHEFYNDWPNNNELHLTHNYNLFHIHLDNYAKKFKFTINEEIKFSNNDLDEKTVKVIHYIGENKPWNNIKKLKNNKVVKNLEEKANRIWYKKYRIFKNKILKDLLENLDSKESKNKTESIEEKIINNEEIQNNKENELSTIEKLEIKNRLLKHVYNNISQKQQNNENKFISMLEKDTDLENAVNSVVTHDSLSNTDCTSDSKKI